MTVTESTFAHLPEGLPLQVKSVSFCRLQPGDFVVIRDNERRLIQRFVGLEMEDGITRLKVCDGHNVERSVPFPRLVGLITAVGQRPDRTNPNPRNIWQRMAFQLKHKLSRSSAA